MVKQGCDLKVVKVSKVSHISSVNIISYCDVLSTKEVYYPLSVIWSVGYDRALTVTMCRNARFPFISVLTLHQLPGFKYCLCKMSFSKCLA